MIKDIEAGGRHVLVMTKNKSPEVYAWGFNYYHQLGQGDEDNEDHLLPVKVHIQHGKKVECLSCGYFTSCIVTKGR